MSTVTSKSSINMVKFWFLKGWKPKREEDMRSVIALAYQTAASQSIYPKEILIRGGAHDTTSFNGQRIKDPKGTHWTFCYKDEKQALQGTHIACHGYTSGPQDYNLREATIAPEKRDDTLKGTGHNKRPVWPQPSELEGGTPVEIGVSHLD